MPSVKAASAPNLVLEIESESVFWWILLGVLLASQVFLRLPLLDIPLERDEGEYAYLGKLILEGVPPFGEAANTKLPGTNLMYAFIMSLFGESASGIHTGLLVTSLGTITCLFFAFGRFFNPLVGVISAGLYSILAVSMPVVGFAAHATHFVVFFMAAGWLALSFFAETRRPWLAFAAGVLFGFCFLMKQHGMFFLAFGGAFILLQLYFQQSLNLTSGLRTVAPYVFGGLLPYLLLVGWMLSSGTFDAFWFWTVEYASAYTSIASASEGLALFQENVGAFFKEFPISILIGLVGLRVLFWGNYTSFQKYTAVVFAVLSALSITPGLYFRQHYIVLFLPALGLLFALTLDVLVQRLAGSSSSEYWRALPLGILALVGLTYYADHEAYFSGKQPQTISRQIYKRQAFADAPQIGQYLRQQTRPSDRIAVLGSEPQLYLYAGRRSATRHIYMYGLMENQPYNLRMQQEVIADIEKTRPKIIVFYSARTTWSRTPTSPTKIFTWSSQYLRRHYQLAVAASVGVTRTRFYPGAELKRVLRMSPQFILIYRRKTALAPHSKPAEAP